MKEDSLSYTLKESLHFYVNYISLLLYNVEVHFMTPDPSSTSGRSLLYLGSRDAYPPASLEQQIINIEYHWSRSP